MHKNNLNFGLMVKKNLNDLFMITKSIIQYLVAILLHSKDENEFYLIGSQYGKKRSDNSIALFNYLKSEGKVVYFLDNRLQGLPNELKRGSFKSFRMYLNAKSVFYSQSFSDILPGMHKASFLVGLARATNKVFIQHGVIGTSRFSMNKTHYIRKYLLSLDKTMNYMVASGEFEKKIIMEQGICASKIMVTGLPRFDNLSTTFNAKEVMIYPTQSKGLEFIEKVDDILGNEGVSVLRESGYKVKTGIHNMMSGRIELPNNIEIIEGAVAEHIRTASLIITDNSSICWDFIYKKAAVIFYKPDFKCWHIQDDFLRARIAWTPEELLVKILEFLKSPSPPEVTYFENCDNENSRRVFEMCVSDK
jgi:CDP-glycerol glycerophosphotransferase (TagB/SpsB family)